MATRLLVVCMFFFRPSSGFQNPTARHRLRRSQLLGASHGLQHMHHTSCSANGLETSLPSSALIVRVGVSTHLLLCPVFGRGHPQPPTRAYSYTFTNSVFVGSCELASHAQFWRLRGRRTQLRNCSTDLGSIARSVRLGGVPPRFANL